MSEEENSVEALIAKISSLEKDVATLTGENSRLNTELNKKLEPQENFEKHI